MTILTKTVTVTVTETETRKLSVNLILMVGTLNLNLTSSMNPIDFALRFLRACCTKAIVAVVSNVSVFYGDFF